MQHPTLHPGLLPLSVAALVGVVTATPARALAILSEVATSTAAEFDTSGNLLRQDNANTASAGSANARVQLGDGTNAFAQPTFAQAFSVFRGAQATYWVNLNADNTFPDNRGIGGAGVQLTYSAIKEAGDTAFTLHTTGGQLRLADPGAGLVPLVARVEIDARVLSGQSVLKQVSASAELFGNGGATSSNTDNFQLLSNGFDIQFGDFLIDLDSNVGSNEVGATLRLRPLNIPVDLSNIVDGTPITISVALNGEVRAPGAETIASAFFRDPTQVDNPDPSFGGSTITFDTSAGPGPVIGVPETSTLALFGSALLVLWACVLRRRAPAGA
jgi:hypothetical protein